MKNKRGITRYQLISLILILFAAGILIWFIVQLGIGEQGEIEACKASAMMRDIAARSKVLPMPELQCKTYYYCLTYGEGCGNTGYEDVSVKSEEDIQKFISDKIEECWSIGGGELQFMEKGERSCAICSVFTFDDTIAKKKKINFAEVINDEKIPDELLEGAETSISLKALTLELVDNEGETIKYSIDYFYAQRDFVKSLKRALKWGAGAAVLIGVASIFTTPVGGVVTLVSVIKVGIAAGVLQGVGTFAIDVGGQFANIKECMAREEGCHVILILPYTSEVLKETCQNFESIP